MAYRVFLVEDEIITREGIRDNVDWNAAGFEFCGEAPDGEIALQLIEETNPDVVITDIKMPFMDGLQLSKIIHEHMPWVKIIILSGHDEFEYAQSAIQIGVTEYLLKPISAKDLHKVLVKVASTLDKEKQEIERLKRLQTRIEESLVLSREKFLLDLVMGATTTSDAIEQSQQLGLEIIGRYYLVALIQIELCQVSQPFDYQQYKHVEQIVSEFAGNNLDIFLTKKDFEELVLFIKGDDREQLIEEGKFLTDLIKAEIEKQTNCKVSIQLGGLQDRLGDVHLSFFEAIVKSKSSQPKHQQSNSEIDRIDLFRIDHDAIDNYLKFGTVKDFDPFFDAVYKPVGGIALHSFLLKQYLFIDLIVTVSEFLHNLDGNAKGGVSDNAEVEQLLDEINSMDELKAQIRQIFIRALDIRNDQTNQERMHQLQKMKVYLDEHFTDPDLKMSQVAEFFNLSPNYFSTVFSQEMGETFRDYLSKLRMQHAKTLLRTTDLKISEIAFQSGYNDAHYFCSVFKKKTSVTPSQFRELPQAHIPEE
ncbi:MAG: response regulator [Anaerolineales bacterium]